MRSIQRHSIAVGKNPLVTTGDQGHPEPFPLVTTDDQGHLVAACHLDLVLHVASYLGSAAVSEDKLGDPQHQDTPHNTPDPDTISSTSSQVSTFLAARAEHVILLVLLKKYTARSYSLSGQCLSINETVRRLKLKVKHQERQIQGLKDEQETESERDLARRELQETVEDLRTEINDLNTNNGITVDGLRTEIDSLTTNNQVTVNELRTEIDRLTTNNQVTVTELRTEIDRLTTNNQNLSNRRDSLFESREELAKSNKKLVEDLGKCEDRNKKLLENCDSLTSINKKQADDNAQLLRTNDELVQVKGQLSKSNEELADHKNQLLKSNQDISDENRRLVKAKDELSNSAQKLSENNSQLVKVNAHLVQVKGQLSKSKKELSDHNKQLLQIMNELSKSNQDLSGENCRLVKTNEELSEYSHKLSDENSQLVKAKKSSSQSYERLQSKNREVMQKKLNLSGHYSKISGSISTTEKVLSEYLVDLVPGSQPYSRPDSIYDSLERISSGIVALGKALGDAKEKISRAGCAKDSGNASQQIAAYFDLYSFVVCWAVRYYLDTRSPFYLRVRRGENYRPSSSFEIRLNILIEFLITDDENVRSMLRQVPTRFSVRRLTIPRVDEGSAEMNADEDSDDDAMNADEGNAHQGSTDQGSTDQCNPDKDNAESAMDVDQDNAEDAMNLDEGDAKNALNADQENADDAMNVDDGNVEKADQGNAENAMNTDEVAEKPSLDQGNTEKDTGVPFGQTPFSFSYAPPAVQPPMMPNFLTSPPNFKFGPTEGPENGLNFTAPIPQAGFARKGRKSKGTPTTSFKGSQQKLPDFSFATANVANTTPAGNIFQQSSAINPFGHDPAVTPPTTSFFGPNVDSNPAKFGFNKLPDFSFGTAHIPAVTPSGPVAARPTNINFASDTLAPGTFKFGSNSASKTPVVSAESAPPKKLDTKIEFIERLIEENEYIQKKVVSIAKEVPTDVLAFAMKDLKSKGQVRMAFNKA